MLLGESRRKGFVSQKFKFFVVVRGNFFDDLLKDPGSLCFRHALRTIVRRDSTEWVRSVWGLLQL